MSSAILRDFAVTIFVRNFRDFLASLCHRCGFILAHVIHVGETFFIVIIIFHGNRRLISLRAGFCLLATDKPVTVITQNSL